MLARKPLKRDLGIRSDLAAKKPAHVEQSLTAACRAMTVNTVADRLTICAQHGLVKGHYIRVEPGWVLHSLLHSENERDRRDTSVEGAGMGPN